MTRRLRYTVLGVLVLVGAGVALLLGGHGEKKATSSFGPFAGYAWRGRVVSVQGSWTVPRVVSGSSLGVAGTWIGAEEPRTASGLGPFIQVGTNEERLPASGAEVRYLAFGVT